MTTSLDSRVYSIREAAQVAGISEWLAGEEIRRTGKLAGIQVIRVGRRILVPRDGLDRVLSGTSTDDSNSGGAA